MIVSVVISRPWIWCSALLVGGLGCSDGPGPEAADQDGATTATSDARSLPDRDTEASWRVDEADPPSAVSSSFVALVQRVGCNSGITGELDEPTIEVDADQIVITFVTLDPPPAGGADCQGNQDVRATVEIGEEIGNRLLVDGLCLSGSQAASTSHCEFGPVRWRPA